MTEEKQSVMQRLRESTRDLHDAAEHHDFQRAFAQGSLPRDRYVDYLGQMYLVHKALEGQLRRAAETSEAIRAVVDERQYQVPYLVEDLVDATTLAGVEFAMDAKVEQGELQLAQHRHRRLEVPGRQHALE